MSRAGYSQIASGEDNTAEIPLVSRNTGIDVGNIEGSRTTQPVRASTLPATFDGVPTTLARSVKPQSKRPFSTSTLPPAYSCRPTIESVQRSSNRFSTASLWKQRVQSLVSPSTHNLADSNEIPADTVRPYFHKRQRWRLWRLSIGEWIATLILCIAYWALLYGWSRMETLSTIQKRAFNTLSTGLTLLLGVNLAASLRSYAKLLRWRLLAARYRSLEMFDLILGCDSQINVLKLLWKDRNSRFRYLPSRTQLACFGWLFVNLAAAIAVSIIGLTYNIDPSPRGVIITTGDISVLDLSSLQSVDYQMDLSRLHSWGVTGESWGTYNITGDDAQDYDQASRGTYGTDNNGYTEYFFTDSPPDNVMEAATSYRYVVGNATCEKFEVVEGQFGDLGYVIYTDAMDKRVNQTIVDTGSSGTLYIAMTNSTCGTRCTNIMMLQAQSYDNDTDFQNPNASFFRCNNTILPVVDISGIDVPSWGQINDDLARMIAGLIGWSDDGASLDSTDVAEYQTYSEFSVDAGFVHDPSVEQVQNQISTYTMGSVAAMDDLVIGFGHVTVTGSRPSSADYLKVHWWRAGAILICIPCVHFATLVLVIAWANKAIIKDDSHLASAKLYHTVIGEMGEHGCMLRGDEIVKHLGNPKVAYGFTGGDDPAEMKHTDVFKLGSGMLIHKQFPQGLFYDGKGVDRIDDCEKPRVDAGMYF